MSCDENSFKHNKQTLQSLSCIKVRFSSPESMMEDLPFFCGWGRDFSLSLEKEFEDTAGVILPWISFELWKFWKLPRLHDAQLWRVFSFKYLSMELCMILRHFSSSVSLFLLVTSAWNSIFRILSSSEGLDGVNWQLTNGQNFNWERTNSLKFNLQLTSVEGFTDNWQKILSP